MLMSLEIKLGMPQQSQQDVMNIQDRQTDQQYQLFDEEKKEHFLYDVEPLSDYKRIQDLQPLHMPQNQLELKRNRDALDNKLEYTKR